MRNWICALLLLAMAAMAHASDKRCTVSFDSATLNVCTGEVDLVNRSLSDLADVDRFASSPVRVVKFDAPIRAEQRAALEQAGAEILGYAPFYAYLVRMAPTLDANVRAIDGVIWTGPFLPVWKLDINLVNDLGGADIVEAGGLDRLTVALHPGVAAAGVSESLLARSGVDLRFTETAFDHERLIVGFSHGQLPATIAALAAQPDVASISLRWDNELMNSQAGWLHQSGEQDNLPIFEQGIFGCGQVVGALDSGLHAANCAFSDTDYGNPVMSTCSDGASCPGITPDFDHRKIGAHYKWSGNTAPNPVDEHGHGTHVMGSIAGNNPAGAVDCDGLTSPGGLTDLDGTAPGAQLISQEAGAGLQYLNNFGGTIYHAATIAYDNGARIHNNSWGSSCRNAIGQCIAGCQVEYRQTTRDADAAVWEFPDLALFVAAGNSGGLGGGSGCGPGADVGAAGNGKNVFSIGSNLRGTGGDSMSGFSSRGPTQDRRSKPDMTAQGSSIISAERNACGTRPSSGTSMATPTAAGLAALVREYLNRGFYPSGVANAADEIENPSGALIKAVMITGAQEINGSGTTGGAPSQSQGWGRVNLGDALYFDGDSRTLWLHDETTGLQTGGDQAYELDVDTGEPLIVTLTWHDYPATVNANPHWVNQLRLEVETPEGDVWTQKLTPGGGLTDPNPFQGTSTTDYDDVNNVHKIILDAPSAGTYEVRVLGIQVAEGGSQPYALAATGRIDAGSGVPPSNQADVGISLFAVPASVELGADVSVITQVGNFGPDAATNVELALVLPPELIYASFRSTVADKAETARGAPDWDCAESDGTVTCTLPGSLAANSLAPALSVTATADPTAAPGPVSIAGTIASTETDPNPANDADEIEIELVGKPLPPDCIFGDGFEDGGDGSCGGGGPPVDPDIVDSGEVDHVIEASVGIDGFAINWVTGDTCNCDSDPGYHFNPYEQTGGLLSFWFWPSGTDPQRAGLSDDTKYLVLQSGATIGPDSTFSVFSGAEQTTAMADWRAGATGYFGFRFTNPDTNEVNYGYAQVTTAGGGGFPMTIHRYWYNSAGNAIAIP